VGKDVGRLRLEALFVRHAPAVLAYARRRTDRVSADDVLGEVFVVAWRRVADVPDDARPWLLGCARRVLANQRRGERRRAALSDRLAAVGGRPVVTLELCDGALASALARLSERDRETLLLVVWEELSSERAAVVVGCSPQAFAVRLHRARKRLSRALADADAVDLLPTMEATR
jgi:RNA polymerase sigma-70 factor (ECF subfamily)